MFKSRIVYTCSKCCMWLKDYEDLLSHMYWRHGTESVQCPQCPLRRWHGTAHMCNVLPGHNEQFNSSSEDSDSDSDSESSSSRSGKWTSDSEVEMDVDEAEFELDEQQYSPDVRTDVRRLPTRLVPAQVATWTSTTQHYNLPRETPWCYCGQHVDGAHMIACDAAGCRYQWYHYACVGVSVAPDGDWVCPSCRSRSFA